MKYSEKLRDPRWQQLRLKAFERDGWQCKCCASKDRTLCVHHLVYSGDPWESPMEHLETLCEDCHEWREDFNNFFGGRSLVSTLFCQLFYGCLQEGFAKTLPDVYGSKQTPVKFINFLQSCITARKKVWDDWRQQRIIHPAA